MGILRNEESTKMFREEEDCHVERHGEDGRREGRAAEAVNVRVFALVFVFVVLVGNVGEDEGFVG